MDPKVVIVWAVCLAVGVGLGVLLAQLLGNNTLILIGAIVGAAAAFFVNGAVEDVSFGLERLYKAVEAALGK